MIEDNLLLTVDLSNSIKDSYDGYSLTILNP